MVAAGILAEDEPVELVEGRLLIVSPQGPPHAYLVGALADLSVSWPVRGLLR